MRPSFNEQFDRLGQWRTHFAEQLAAFGSWLGVQNLRDLAVQDHLQRLEHRLRHDRLSLAFVAESSRGKSDLINAVFFAHYGQRIMPTAPGRTTLCPTELLHDPQLPSCLRLLPIETRSQAYSLTHWRSRPHNWVQLPLDESNPQQMAEQIAKVAQVQSVSIEQARSLGFWNDAIAQGNPPTDAQGMVQIPCWRYALVHIAHPLLQQGLVILDTPGLNTVGAEPELTVNHIAQTDAVVFLLAADAGDTGLTQADLTLWQEHLLPSHREGGAHLVVLNKIDTLWQHAHSEEQALQLLTQLRQACADSLGISSQRILPLSAKQGLSAKIEKNPSQLRDSGLSAFEDALALSVLSHRQNLLEQTVAQDVEHIRQQVQHRIGLRKQSAQAHAQALHQLDAHNRDMLAAQLQHIGQEQAQWSACQQQVQHLRRQHLRLMNQAFHQLGTISQRRELEQLRQALGHSGIKTGMRQVYASAFERLHDLGARVQASASEVQALLTTEFAQLNAQFGLHLQAPPAFAMPDFDQALEQVEQSYLQYLGLEHVLKLAHPLVGERLVHALGIRLGSIFEAAASALDIWSQASTAQLQAQLQQRQSDLSQRLAVLQSIAQDASQLHTHSQALSQQQQHLQALEQALAQWCTQLLHLPQVDAADAALALEASLPAPPLGQLGQLGQLGKASS